MSKRTYKWVWMGPGDGLPASIPGRYATEREARAWIRETYGHKRLIGYAVWQSRDQS